MLQNHCQPRPGQQAPSWQAAAPSADSGGGPGAGGGPVRNSSRVNFRQPGIQRAATRAVLVFALCTGGLAGAQGPAPAPAAAAPSASASSSSSSPASPGAAKAPAAAPAPAKPAKPARKAERTVEVVEPQSSQRFPTPLHVGEQKYLLVGVGLRKQPARTPAAAAPAAGTPTPPVPGAAPVPGAPAAPAPGRPGVTYPALRSGEDVAAARAKEAPKPVAKPGPAAAALAKAEEHAYAMALYVEEVARIPFASVYERAGRSKNGLLVESRAQHFITWGHFTKLAVLRFLRDTPRGELQQLFREGLEDLLSDKAPPELRRDAEAFIALFDKDVRAGQEVRIRTDDTGLIEIQLPPDAPRPGPASPKLCRHVWDIWLGYHPVSKEMRNSLIDRLEALHRTPG